MSVIRLELCYYGTVQGVGFRWRARQLADALGLVGFAENRPDGSVRVQVQGEEELTEQFADRMGTDRGWISISHIERKRIPLRDEYWFTTH